MSAELDHGPTYHDKTLARRICDLLEINYDLMDQNGPKRWEELAQGMAELEEIKSTVSFLLGHISSRLYDELPEHEVVMDGVGLFTKQSGSKRTAWDKERLVALLGSRSADDLDEDAPRAVVAEHAANEVLRCAGISYFRVTELRKRHINADDYCEKSEGSPRVQFTREA